MGYLFIGIIALGLLVLALHWFAKANPVSLARTLRLGLGISALAIAGFLTAFGRLFLAVPLAWVGMMLLGRRLSIPGGFPGSGRPSPGQTSRVRTATLEMTLDHDTGDMDGTVLAGGRRGARLSELALDDLIALRKECAAGDPKAAQLLDAFLDRTHEGWREIAGVGGRAKGEGHKPGTGEGAMTRDEALEILGVAPGASRDDIRRAHRQLMKKLHPDQGGSNYLASKVNEAKDLLLGT